MFKILFFALKFIQLAAVVAQVSGWLVPTSEDSSNTDKLCT